MDEDIGLPCSLFLLFFLLHISEKSIAAEIEILIEFKAAKSFVSLDFAKGVFLVGS